MNQYGYALLGLTALVALLVSVLVFAMLRFAAAARDARRSLRETGTETALLSIALQDAVSRLKAQEAEMRARADESERLSGDIVDSLTAGLLVVDQTGHIEILNAAGRRLLGASEDVIGAHYTAALSSIPPLIDIVRESLRSGVPVVRRAIQAGGRTPVLHLGVSVSPLRRADALRGVIGLFSDLTEVVELEEQLRLKEALARLGELTAGIAHEFRNGLATIHGYARLMDPQALPEQYRPYLEGLRQEAEALGQVVTNFLNFARPEQIVFAGVDLESVVRRVADELRHELPGGACLTVAGRFGEIQGDEVLLRQMFSNLVRNAVEACEAAGISPAIEIRGDVDERQHTCRVAVDDNGPGIPPDVRERIFQPFFTTRSRGTGLGLAIVLKIAVLHNGRAAVADSRHGGASIRITFPTTSGFQRRYYS